jgi:hypothetical protein
MKRAFLSPLTSGVGALAAFLGLLVAAASCGESVERATGGSGGTATCGGTQVQCADTCGSDYFPASADCKNGEWVCPAGTVDPADCPSNSCSGEPLACEKCGAGAWECSPDEACTMSCGGIVCRACPVDLPGEVIFDGCTCKCDASGKYTCAAIPGCCNTDLDCGDEKLTPCVNGVCKEPVADACWSDVECMAGMKCEGASVCQCGANCLVPDSPGMCVPE